MKFILKKRFSHHAKIYLLTLFLISIFLASNASYLYGYAVAAAGNIITTIQPGAMVQNYAYMIFTDGAVYYAKSGVTGSIDFSGLNSSAVITSAINAVYAPSNGTIIFIHDGSYGSVATPCNIILKRGVNLIGESSRGTVIHGTISFSQTVSEMPYLGDGCIVEHLNINAKSVSQNYALDLESKTGGPSGSTFNDLRLTGTVADLYLNGSDMFDDLFTNIVTNYGGTYGVLVNGMVDQCLFDNLNFGVQDYGFYMTANGIMANSRVFNVFTDLLVHNGLTLTRCARNTFDHLVLSDFPDSADVNYVVLNDSSGYSVPMSSNVFTNCVFIGGNTGGGVPTYQSGRIYVGKNWFHTTFNDCSGMGQIYISAFANYTIINDFGRYITTYYNVGPVIYDYGANTKVTFSWNSSTWINSYP